MPTNVSQPIWRCDICGTRMGDNLPAAERCEAAGVPAVLPPGELLLSYQKYRWGARRPPGFSLARLYPLPLDYAVGTLASTHGDKSGHYPLYCVDVDPVPYIGQDRVLRFPSHWPEQKKIQGDWVQPHQPGHLNVIAQWMPGRRQGVPFAKGTRWVAEAVGLAMYETPVEKHTLDGRMVRPLTEPVRAVLDALEARIIPATTDPARLGDWNQFAAKSALGATALEACPTRSGARSKGWAETWLHSHSHAEVLHDVNERWRRWRAGEAITVPYPHFRCGVKLTASKLPKAMKALVAATGVEWPARTDSAEYARTLLTKTLETRMETTDKLFDAAQRIAVTGTKGGVGKSSVAAALARRLAGEGRRVVLVDCDLTGPSQHVLFNLGPALTDPQQGRVLPSPTDVPGLAVFSPGQVFAPGSIGWTPETIADWVRFVGSSVAMDDADVVVLDLPPGDSTVHEMVFRSHEITVTASIHVTTGHPLALADTDRGLAALENQLPAMRHTGRAVLVENLSRATGTIAGGLGHTVEIRLVGDEDAVRGLAQRHNLRYAGSLPWCPDVADLADSDEVGELAAAVVLAEAVETCGAGR